MCPPIKAITALKSFECTRKKTNRLCLNTRQSETVEEISFVFRKVKTIWNYATLHISRERKIKHLISVNINIFPRKYYRHQSHTRMRVRSHRK